MPARRRLLDEVDDYYRALGPQVEPKRLLLRSQTEAGDERWHDAIAIAAQIDRAAMTPDERTTHARRFAMGRAAASLLL